MLNDVGELSENCKLELDWRLVFSSVRMVPLANDCEMRSLRSFLLLLMILKSNGEGCNHDDSACRTIICNSSGGSCNPSSCMLKGYRMRLLIGHHRHGVDRLLQFSPPFFLFLSFFLSLLFCFWKCRFSLSWLITPKLVQVNRSGIFISLRSRSPFWSW